MSAQVTAAHYAAAAEAVTGGSPQERDVVERVAQAIAEADNELIVFLQGRRRDALRALRASSEANADYWRWQGHAELSRQLLERMGAEVPR